MPKEATPDQIKKAHRRLVMTAHPDTGGDPEQFQAIQTAYEVLMDPERRRRYDNGEPDTPEVMQAAMNFLGSTFLAMIEQGGELSLMKDIIDGLRSVTRDTIKKAEGQPAKLRSKIEVLKQAKERVTFSGNGQNFLASAAEIKINQCEQRIRTVAFELSLLQMALTLLDDYQFEMKDEPPRTFDGASFADFFMRYGGGKSYGFVKDPLTGA